MKKSLLAVGLTVMMMFLVAPVAQAATIYYFDQTGYSAGNPGPSPYGSVTLTQVGSNVDVSVALFNGNQFVNTGFDYNFFFNATGVTTGDLSGTGSFAGLLTFASDTFHADGSGYWEFGVVKTGQQNGAGFAYNGPLTFEVANASISDLVEANAAGNIFAADTYNPTSGGTGMIWTEGTTRVPEASALILFSTGLVGLVTWRRKKRLE